jgi:hypothetical protein
LLAAASVNAQTVPVDVRALVNGARLGAGYAQIIGLAATPDIAAASYEIDSTANKPTLDVFRLPYQSRWLALYAVHLLPMVPLSPGGRLTAKSSLRRRYPPATRQ